MDLIISDIEKDIAGYQERIAKARKQIDRLPTGRLPYQGHKRREKVKRESQAEIEHKKDDKEEMICQTYP